MLDKMTNRLDFLGNALVLRSERQRVLASNIANADTPGFVSRDFKFSDALTAATASTSESGSGATRMPMSGYASTLGTTDRRHIPGSATSSGTTVSTVAQAYGKLAYGVQTQPSMDNNSVDLDRERANFADNAVRYEAALRFINGNAKTMLSAIQGQ